MKGDCIGARIFNVFGACLACVVFLTSCQGGKMTASLELSQLLKDNMFCY